MNVYDFDGTLYQGESSVDFAIYCILKKPKILSFLPVIFSLYQKHKRNRLNKEEINVLFQNIVETIQITEEELDNLVFNFWKRKKKKLNWSLIDTMEENDLILSAGPDFLLKNSPLKKKNIICSQIDLKKKKILFFCYGSNKRESFEKLYKNQQIQKFYTDSYSDEPLMSLAQEVYFIKKGKGLGKKLEFKQKEEKICK